VVVLDAARCRHSCCRARSSQGAARRLVPHKIGVCAASTCHRCPTRGERQLWARSLPPGRGPANGWNRRVSPVAVRPGEGPLTERTAGVQPARREQVFMLRVFGRLPGTDSAARSEGRRPKTLRGGNRGGVCGGSGVGLWGFSACVCPHLSVSNGDPRLSNHHGVGFGRRVQDRNGGLVVSGLGFGGRRRR